MGTKFAWWIAADSASRRAAHRAVASALFCGAAGTGLAVVALGGTTVSAAALTACATHQCDPHSYDFFDGFPLDDDTFVTSAWVNDAWLTYPGGTTIRVWFPPIFANREIKSIEGWVGTDRTPNGGDAYTFPDNFTPAVGQLGYYLFLNTESSNRDDTGNPVGFGQGHLVGGGFWATNATCSPYFARFEVDFVPLAEAGVVDADAGVAASGEAASPDDAGTE